MRQHPIPQNVLDVEFKLFTKFTLKEFAYLVAGIISGSVFLLLNRQVGLPGLIAWPAFIALSAVGAFFALVPINDQNADEFVKNYFTAINKPTQRVWLNDQMQENRKKPVINNGSKDKPKIIGGDLKENQEIFTENPGDDIFETEAIPKKEEKKPQVEAPAVASSKSPVIRIGAQNISQYQFSIQSVDRLPGNINIWVGDVNNRGLTNIPVFLKDEGGKVIFANRTGPNGYFLTNQVFPHGVYYIQFDQSIYQIPTIQLLLDQNVSKSPIKITAQLK